MALKHFLMVAFVAAMLVACSNFVADSDEESSSSACEDCDGSSSSKAKSSSSSAKSSSSAASSSSKDVEPVETSSSSSSVDSSSSSAKSSSSVASSSSVPEGYVDPSTVVKGTMTDERDGQTYKTVKIGTQIWMAENLNYTSDSTSWCYNDSVEYCAKYGRLYTWAAAMDSVGTWSTNSKGCGYGTTCSPTYPVRGVCPEGWHLPTTAEFEKLFNAVGGELTVGKMLKSTSGWNSSGNGTDAYAFSALPAGNRSDYGDFLYEGYCAYFWSSTEYSSGSAYYILLGYGSDHAYLDFNFKVNGFSVRCVKRVRSGS